MESEVLIIGGGVIGLSIARELNKKGAGQITVIDRGPIGGEASWAAAGMLAPNIETDLDPDFHRFGTESLELYPKFAAELLEETGIDIKLDRSGTLCLAFSEDERIALQDFYPKQEKRSVPVEFLLTDDVHRLEPSISPKVQAALFYRNDWQVDNRKLVAALQEYARRNSVNVIENREVFELLIQNRRVLGARTSAGDVRADITVIATGAWTSLITIGDRVLPISIRPIRGQMISFSPGERLLQHVVYSHRGYLVPRSDGRILVGATVEDVGFDKVPNEDGINEMKSVAVEILPRLTDETVRETWAGLRPFAEDGLPVLGNIPTWENVVVATGHYRNGILLAPKTAEIMADNIIDGVDSEYLELYNAGRFTSAANATTNS